MVVVPPPALGARAMAWLPFVLSAAFAAVALRLFATAPRTAAVFAALAALLMTPAYVTRRRLRQVLRSGDVERVLRIWSGSFSALPFPETMQPLVIAAAFASCGWAARARSAMARSAKGPAWDAALEHRLFIETLLDTYEGHRDAALTKARELVALPPPPVGPFARGRVLAMRSALSAFARAFAHEGQNGDLDLLERASNSSPLVHWAMRYAAAVLAVDRGDKGRARKLIANAPAWPEGCSFRDFQAELALVIASCGATATRS